MIHAFVSGRRSHPASEASPGSARSRHREDGDQLLCTFCGEAQKDVAKLIAGPGVYVCNECVDLCVKIIDEEREGPQPPPTARMK